MIAIERVYGREILDSRGTPTVWAAVVGSDGSVGEAAVPSGASTGKHEAVEMRDGGARYNGKGVLGAVARVNGEIAEAARGLNVCDQAALDRRLIDLDGTARCARLGANAMLAVSMACARAGAQACRLPLYRYLGGIFGAALPMPMMNILNGGAHAANNLDIQEFMIRPIGARDFPEALELCARVYAALRDQLAARGLSCGVGDEGGYAPSLARDEDALDLLMEAICACRLLPGRDVTLALDAAAAGWVCEDGAYRLPKRGTVCARADLTAWYADLCGAYPIDSIEDPLGEDDFEGFADLRARLPDVQIVGDDLFVTNPMRLRLGIAQGSATAILIKPNQIGTVTETLRCVAVAKQAGMGVVVSHRSGETEDSFIADLAVAVNAGQIKTGAPARSERTAKYNRLLHIAAEVGGAYR